MKPSRITQSLQRGLTAHQAGRLTEARIAYLEALKLAPQNPDALHLLGVAVGALGETDHGIELISQAIHLCPQQADYLFNLGNLQLSKKQFAAATNNYRSALRLNPGMPDVWANLALVQSAQGNHAEAREAWRQSLALDPKQPDHWLRLAESYHDSGLLQEAADTYTAATLHAPNHVAIACNHGNILRELSRFREAAETYRRAVALAPNNHETWNNLGVALKDLGRIKEAVDAFRQSIHNKPDYAEAFSNLAPALQQLNRAAEAIDACQHALALNPVHDGALTNLGNALLANNRTNEAIAAFARARECNPCNHVAFKNEGIAHLLSGNLLTGFALYEARWEEAEFRATRHNFARTQWLGEQPLAGRSILLHSEQGLGDTIQFARYAPLLVRQGARVYLEAPAPLFELLSDLPGPTVFPQGAPLPHSDFHCSLLSLPCALKTNINSIPAPIPYLQPRTPRIARWQSAADQLTGLKVGVVWSGNPNHKNDHNRSIPFTIFKTLFTCINASFTGLQKEMRSEELPELSPCPTFHNWASGINDFSDTAGLIQHMDLVISVDTSVAHLAGAMGKPTWVLLPFSPDWRWLLNTDRSPWYPTVRLFRQPKTGDWETVLAQVATSLAKLTSNQPPAT